MIAAALLGAAAAALAVPAPKARVVILDKDGSPAQSAFNQMLQIQLRDLAVVEVLTGPSAAPAPGPGASALSVWVEREAKPTGPSEIVVRSVGLRADGAAVEVGRVAEGQGPDADRALAIKVAELVSGALAAPRPAPPSPAPQARPRRRWGIDGGGVGAVGVSPGAAAQIGAMLGIEVRFARDRSATQLAGSVAVLNRYRAVAAQGNVVVEEADVAVGVRQLKTFGRFGIGVAASVIARLVSADGTNAGGRTGSTITLIPALSATIEAQLELGHRFGLRLGVGPELALVRRQFEVDGATIVDLGRWRPSATLGFSVFLP